MSFNVLFEKFVLFTVVHYIILLYLDYKEYNDPYLTNFNLNQQISICIHFNFKNHIIND